MIKFNGNGYLITKLRVTDCFLYCSNKSGVHCSNGDSICGSVDGQTQREREGGGNSTHFDSTLIRNDVQMYILKS